MIQEIRALLGGSPRAAAQEAGAWIQPGRVLSWRREEDETPVRVRTTSVHEDETPIRVQTGAVREDATPLRQVPPALAEHATRILDSVTQLLGSGQDTQRLRQIATFGGILIFAVVLMATLLWPDPAPSAITLSRGEILAPPDSIAAASHAGARRSRRPARSALAAGSGLITSSPAGATVVLLSGDRQRVLASGQTPFIATELRGGERYLVLVTMSGYLPQEVELIGESRGQEASRHVELEPTFKEEPAPE